MKIQSLSIHNGHKQKTEKIFRRENIKKVFIQF